MNPRSTQRLLWGILGAALLLLAAFALFRWMHQDARANLEDYGPIPHFTLLNQNGDTVTNADLHGKIWVADLIFTHCTSICPLITDKMSDIQKQVAGEENVKLISLSVDPTHDRPDTLLRYAAEHHADPKQWTFLTGTVPMTYTVIKQGFHLPVDSVGGDQEGYPIIHSPRFVLIDGSGHMRGYYDGLVDSSRARLISDISALRSEQEKSDKE